MEERRQLDGTAGDRRNYCTRLEDCPHASLVAEKAVRKTFAILGYDLDKPSELEELRRIIRFAEDMRKFTNKGMAGAATLIFGALAAGLWALFQHKIGN